jgi:penicillin-binding protein-related factor A (putative recombinase)
MANAFESEIKKSADAMGLHYRKVPVPTKLSLGGGQPRLIKLKKPDYDGYYVHNGKHVAVELKSSTLCESFPISRIEQHQRDGLKAILDRGCPAYLLINMRWEMRDGKKKLNNRAWALPWAEWPWLLSALGGSKSIPTRMFHDPRWFIPIPHIHFSDPAQGSRNILCWDARSFLE